MPVPHHSVFTGWMPFLLLNQQCQGTEGKLVFKFFSLKDVLSTSGEHAAMLTGGFDFRRWVPTTYL